MFQKNNTLDNADISAFCQQINMIVKAGFPVYYGISILKDSTDSKETKALLDQIYEPLEAGASLFDSLSATGVFPNYMLQMIHLGEKTGHLENVLSSLTAYYQREDEIRNGIRHAIAYPLVMSVMMLSILVIIITKVVPIFSNVYAELGSGLTASARLLMNISTFLNQYLLVLILALFALILAVFAFFKTPKGRQLWESRGIALSLATSRFANCMYLTLSSVLDIEQGFTFAEELIDNSHMQRRIQHCRDLIAKEESLAKAFLDSGIFSKMYASLLTIGYKTSSMDEVMLSISQAYEKETDEKIHHFISILEPLLIIILSFFTGLILISFLLPLLGIMSSIG